MKKIRILLYHRVEDLSEDVSLLSVSPCNFDDHMKYINENYDVLRLNDDFEEWMKTAQRDAVIITFDDGYYDWYTKALPILGKYNIPATMFITTGYVDSDKEFWTENLHRALFEQKIFHEKFVLEDELVSGCWKTASYEERYDLYKILRKIFQISSNDKRKEYEKKLLEWAGLTESGRENRKALTTQQIKRLSESPLIDVGVHTVTHASLRWQTIEEQKREIVDSKRALEDIIGQAITLFSYPFGTKGDFSDETIKILCDNGFEKAVVGYPGEINAQSDMYRLKRFTVRNYAIDEFKDYLDGKVFDKKVEKKIGYKRRSKIEYVGTLNEDNLANAKEIIIWGTGVYAQDVFNKLCGAGHGNKIIAFADNDRSKVNTKFNGLEVLSADHAMKRDAIFVVKSTYDGEICKQLICNDIEHVHWIIE